MSYDWNQNSPNNFIDLFSYFQIKFRMEIEPWIFAADLLYVEKINTLPRMIKPISLDELKSFFRKLAVDLGKKKVE